MSFKTRIDLTGQRFTRWTVIGPDSDYRAGQMYWFCICDCGVRRSVGSNRLRRGTSRSCGCLQREEVAVRSRAANGDKSSAWKGAEASYFAMHQRVNTARGRPQHCEQCGTTDSTKTYDWANLTGDYGDVNDYRRMCRSCHRKYDGIKPPPRTTANRSRGKA